MKYSVKGKGRSAEARRLVTRITRLGAVLAVVFAVMACLVVQDRRNSQKIHIVPNLAFLSAVAFPILRVSSTYLSDSVLSTPPDNGPFLIGTWLFALIAILLPKMAPVSSSADGKHIGRKRYWAGIAIIVLFGGRVSSCMTS